MTISLDAVSRENLQERAYGSIRAAISEGQLLPGVAFTIRDLAAQLEISTTPVREALKRLIAEQALELKPNRSLMVPVIGARRIVEIRDLRMMLEGRATARATARLTDSELARLASMHSEMQDLKNETAFLKVNREFHFAIYERAESPVTLKLIDQLWLQSGPAVRRLMTSRDLISAFNNLHGDILDSLMRRDSAAACAAVCADITTAAEALLRIENESGANDDGRRVESLTAM